MEVSFIPYTYEKPDSEDYLRTLIKYLEVKGEKQIADLLRGSRCVINETSTFSRKRWDAFWTTVYFYVSLSELEKVTPEITGGLLEACAQIMPIDAGLDVMHVEFLPLIESAETVKTATEEIERAAGGLSREVMAKILPADLIQKGRDMATVYLYLYCIENSLRLFVEQVAKSKMTLSSEMKKKISDRKAEAGKKKWLPARGDSDIFYLDFDDLGSIIRSNWKLFKDFFPDQNWIVAKIDELVDCRNLVAHNSYLEDHQRDVVKVYYASILKQLASTLGG